jgi:hypothetical protein
VNLYIHSPIRLNGVVFNSLSTGITLLLFPYSTLKMEAAGSFETSVPTYQVKKNTLLLSYLSKILQS